MAPFSPRACIGRSKLPQGGSGHIQTGTDNANEDSNRRGNEASVAGSNSPPTFGNVIPASLDMRESASGCVGGGS